MSADLAQRVQMAFDRCKEFPEAGVRGGVFHVRSDAYLALIELRNLCPDIVLALQSAEPRSCSEQEQRPLKRWIAPSIRPPFSET